MHTHDVVDLEHLSEPLGCLGLSVRRASRAMTSFYNERLKPTGVLVTQTPVLFGLRLMGSATVAELAAALGMDQTTLSRNIKPMIRDGWVDMTTGDDKRQRHLRLTPAGIAKCEQVYPCWRQAQDEFIRLTGRTQEELLEMISSLEAATVREPQGE